MSGVYNASEPNGGDSLVDSAAINEMYSPGDFAWILFASALVWLMIPGIGYVFSQNAELTRDFFTADLPDERVPCLSSGKV